MGMLNVWRIPILFYISGMGVCFAMRKRNWKALIKERAQRILIPFIFGVVAIVPLHILLWQHYYHQDLAYAPHPVHLWFLGNIFLYVLVLSPFFYFLKRNPESRFGLSVKKFFGKPWGVLLILLVFALEARGGEP